MEGWEDLGIAVTDVLGIEVGLEIMDFVFTNFEDSDLLAAVCIMEVGVGRGLSLLGVVLSQLALRWPLEAEEGREGEGLMAAFSKSEKENQYSLKQVCTHAHHSFPQVTTLMHIYMILHLSALFYAPVSFLIL